INLDEGSLNVTIDAEPKNAIVGETIQFTASASGGTEPYTYNWNFGDGNTSTNQNPTHTYDTQDNYTVSLSVQDDIGAYGSNYVKVNIILTHPPNKPVINGSDKYLPGQDEEYTFSATDPDNNDVYLKIDWGDGEKTEWLGPYNSGEDVQLTHRWNGDGVFTITAKSKDTFDFESQTENLEVTPEWNEAFMIGTAQKTHETNNTIELNAVSVFYLSFDPFEFNKYSSGEKIIISKDDGGFIGKNFVIGKFQTGKITIE
ncbi:MAG: PKD domain-containing protein, partial [Candidatus Thermoplasmatota archaeon]